MTLSEQINGLHESADGSGSQPVLRETLERMIVGTAPGDLSAAEEEIRRLKFEAAIAKVDAELETAKQECMMHYRGSMHEPGTGEVWGMLILGTVSTSFFLWLGFGLMREMGPIGGFTGFGAAACLSFVAVRHSREAYVKSKRLQAAKSQWERARRLLIEAQTAAGA